MNVVERPMDELTSYRQALSHVVNTVLEALPVDVLEHSLLSGFDANHCLDGESYQPTAEGILNGELWAVNPRDRISLALVGRYAVDSVEPAVGVYDARMFRGFNSVGYVVNSGLTIVEACTDIFVWRE